MMIKWQVQAGAKTLSRLLKHIRAPGKFTTLETVLIQPLFHRDKQEIQAPALVLQTASHHFLPAQNHFLWATSRVRRCVPTSSRNESPVQRRLISITNEAGLEPPVTLHRCCVLAVWLACFRHVSRILTGPRWRGVTWLTVHTYFIGHSFLLSFSAPRTEGYLQT